ncbi:MAG: ABC transporter ATP-binding protein/permease [candidate division KSB1 bacterium]|nr:ABC transporter ATP-binding protein/permease [candidate division KSB1 bacterium]MDZ7273337.1 ABC transporter ATP-binding protein/permease [candidate division KSB1 bacterium]MDZ7287999.1 ABC transporter ATP-binding protein/permease [candidate division KSB1 bacterium]MDZ7300149.1 ABC transporter ATP-binding protein/permease [candidate division KSB1 bacterium]MDZ7308914.1 ABC transporter ATP-binding protein/permease [candidate division KSB1 bacterium]
MAGYDEEKLTRTYDAVLMRRLLRYVRPMRGRMALAVSLLLLSSGLSVLGPLLTKIAIDRHIANKDLRGLTVVALAFLAILLLGLAVNYSRAVLMERIGQRIMYDLRMQIFGHLQRLPLAFFNRNPVGRLMTRVTNDVESLNELFTSGLVAVFGDIFMLGGIILALFQLNWQLTLLTLATVPLLYLATAIFKKKVREAERDIRVRLAKINAFLQENITGMTVVQLFNREEKNFRQFDGKNREYLEAYRKTIFYYAVFYPVVEFIGALAVALIIWYGGGQVIAGALSFGALVAFIMYVEMFFRPISDLAEKYGILQTAMASAERIFRILDEPDELAGTNGVSVAPAATLPARWARGEIEFRHVSFGYRDDELVLQDVSFKIAAGETVAIVGATGAGKTTLISLLSRFYTPKSGRIFIDGRDVATLPLYDVRAQIGLVLQDVFLFADTIAENIRLGNPAITLEAVRQAAAEVNALRFIEKLPQQFQEMVLERGNSLSVGQKQLIAFARALAYDPPILVLDEATSSVDTETELLIQAALERLMRGRTSLIIAHRLSTIQHASRVIVMHKGQVRESGTHEELMALRGIYYRLYQLQFAPQEKLARRAG